VQISRAHVSARLPASFQLVAAMNPCPCGLGGTDRCSCGEAGLQRYARRVSGPFMDRFDLRLRVHPTPRSALMDERPAESTAEVRERVSSARCRAQARGAPNARLTAEHLREASTLDDGARRMLDTAIESGRLSGRGLVKVRRVALTLDDLRGGSGLLDGDVVAQALALRTELDLASRRLVTS